MRSPESASCCSQSPASSSVTSSARSRTSRSGEGGDGGRRHGSRAGSDDDVRRSVRPARTLAENRPRHLRGDTEGPSRHGRLMETTSDLMPSRFHVFLRYRGRLRRLPMTFEDSDMFRASQSRSTFLPSRWISTIHARRSRSNASRNASGDGGSRVIGSVSALDLGGGVGSARSGSASASPSSASRVRFSRYWRLTRQRASTDRYWASQ